MGIVNVTPDSFSDGGRYFDSRAAIDHGLEMVAEGADLLDVGGESTRPYATPVMAEEELRRVMPVVTALCRQAAVPVSIDTSKAVVAREAIRAGAEIINDVTGLAGDPAMLDVAGESGAGVCVMHMLGTPQTMQDNPRYAEASWMRSWLGFATAATPCCVGESPRIASPWTRGLGSAKRTDHNLRSAAPHVAIARTGMPAVDWPFAERLYPACLGQRPWLGWRACLGRRPSRSAAGTIGASLAV